MRKFIKYDFLFLFFLQNIKLIIIEKYLFINYYYDYY